MIVNRNVTGIGIRQTTEGRAKVVYTTIFSAGEELDAYDGDFPVTEARDIMRKHRAEKRKLNED